ncbi:MAG: cupin domain-containing protein [Chitinophagaceae bacterium]|nr:cupin domain-containing protein [Chitinophagaceae bacterium]
MKKAFYLLIVFSATFTTSAFAQETSVFPKGEIGTNTDNYTGTIWLNELSKPDSIFKFGIAQAVYAPGSKLDWHIHPGGQILLITEGTGYYQEKGKPVQIVHKGDVIKCAPGVEHWHGATPNSTFAYVAISPSEKGKTIWKNRVTDAEYNSIKPDKTLNNNSGVQDTSIFPKGFVAPNTDDYTGTVWLNGLSMEDSVFPFSLMQATFAPGSRLRWHIHPKGQILLIMKGTGYYMEKGKPARIVHKGDVIKCTPGVAHTHMAAPNSDFAYIGIESRGIKWLERVTDDEYNSVK